MALNKGAFTTFKADVLGATQLNNKAHAQKRREAAMKVFEATRTIISRRKINAPKRCGHCWYVSAAANGLGGHIPGGCQKVQTNTSGWPQRMQRPYDISAEVLMDVVPEHILQLKTQCPAGAVSPQRDMDMTTRLTGYKRPPGDRPSDTPAKDSFEATMAEPTGKTV